MSSIHELKRQEVVGTPVLLYECTLRTGTVERWSTHACSFGGSNFAARVVEESGFDLRLGAEEGIDASGRMRVTLANADSYGSQIERSVGWKGARLLVRFGLLDLEAGTFEAEPVAVYSGIANPPEETGEKTMRLSFTSRLSMQRVMLPTMRVQRRCPWAFPEGAAERAEAVSGGSEGEYSVYYGCGYSAGEPEGRGNLQDGAPFASCDRTKEECASRGMQTRFAGFQYLPASILVRGHGEKSSEFSQAVEPGAQANDAAPLVYGTAWYKAPVIYSRSDGNYARCEVLLGSGPIEGVQKVIANRMELPLGRAGYDLSGTGWYNIVSYGERDGAANPDFADEGDPHGGMAVLSVVIPKQFQKDGELPRIEVLVDGLKLPRFDGHGDAVDKVFSRNPAWVLLDVLRRSGWKRAELDLGSFSTTAQYCDELIPARDQYGNTFETPRFEVNLALISRRSASEVLRGVRSAAGLLLTFDGSGKLRLQPEATLAAQAGSKAESSNATASLNGGWPAYEFGDGTYGRSNILREANRAPSIRLWCRSAAESPNRYSTEFQNSLNGYQQDSLSLVEIADHQLLGAEVNARHPASGLPNHPQAMRVLKLALQKSLAGNEYVEFDTTVHALGLRPGDLITVTYMKEGLDREVFRILRLQPRDSYARVRVTAQRHEDSWYEQFAGEEGSAVAGSAGHGDGTVPYPLAAMRRTATGEPEFDVAEEAASTIEGQTVQLSVGFRKPAKPSGATQAAPLLSTTPTILDGGGLPGGEVLYYGVSSVGSDGAESTLSYLVKAVLPEPGPHSVRLEGLRFRDGARGFKVYRGATPLGLKLIRESATVASTFVDDGRAAMEQSPPDANYDHANFYWRRELLPPVQVASAAALSVEGAGLSLAANAVQGNVLRLVSGRGAGQERKIESHDSERFVLDTPWAVTPDATSRFVVADGSWRFGGRSDTEMVRFEVPLRSGNIVQLMGAAASSRGLEAPFALSPVHRYALTGTGAGTGDNEVPGMPDFVLTTEGAGDLQLAGIRFEDLTNTDGVQSGTLALHYWSELTPSADATLSTSIDDTADWVDVSPALPVEVSDMLLADGEMLQVIDVEDEGARLHVARARCGSEAAAHSASAEIRRLQRRVEVMAFPRGFFRSAGASSYANRITVRNAVIVGAEFWVTNRFGDSPVRRVSYTDRADGGLRTLSGGQYALQVNGELALESNATPPLVIEENRAVRRVVARMNAGPSGGEVVLRLRRDGEIYTDLTVPDGESQSEEVSGLGRAPLAAGSVLTLDVAAVPQTAGSRPGRDVTVLVQV